MGVDVVKTEKTIVESFTIGGTAAGPSVIGPRLQRMIGKRIEIDIVSRQLYVPTLDGVKIAKAGDKIVLYDDDTLEVRRWRVEDERIGEAEV